VFELRLERIAALLLETAPPVTSRPGAVDGTPAGIAVSDASPALLDATARMLALLDAPGDAAVLAAGVEREVLWRLLTGPHVVTVRQIGLADSRLTQIGRAIQCLLVSPPLPCGDLDDADPVPEAAPPARGEGSAPR
jgi:hypothetical protein